MVYWGPGETLVKPALISFLMEAGLAGEDPSRGTYGRGHNLVASVFPVVFRVLPKEKSIFSLLLSLRLVAQQMAPLAASIAMAFPVEWGLPRPHLQTVCLPRKGTGWLSEAHPRGCRMAFPRVAGPGWPSPRL